MIGAMRWHGPDRLKGYVSRHNQENSKLAGDGAINSGICLHGASGSKSLPVAASVRCP